jgi:hypothetical protein
VSAAISAEPLYDLTAPDGVRHTIWRLAETEALVSSFEAVPLALHSPMDIIVRASASPRARRS